MTPKRLTELAYVLGILGALSIAFGALGVVLASRSYEGGGSSHRREKYAYLVGAVLIAIAFFLLLVAILTKTTPSGTAGALGSL